MLPATVYDPGVIVTQMFVRVWLLFMLVLPALPTLVSAQSRGKEISPGTRHPTPENIPEPSHPGLVLREERDEKGAVRAFIYDADVDSVVGVSEREHHEMFGYVSDVASDGLDTLYIMDSEFK